MNWSVWVQQMLNSDMSKISNVLSILVFQIGSYIIWRARNNRFFTEDLSSPAWLAFECLSLLKCRLNSSKWFTKCASSDTSIMMWVQDNQ